MCQRFSRTGPRCRSSVQPDASGPNLRVSLAWIRIAHRLGGVLARPTDTASPARVSRWLMARIEMTPDHSWDGELGELHARVVDPTHRRVDNLLAVHSLNPRSMATHQGLCESAMAGTATLRNVERELIALVVSLTNHCHWSTTGADAPVPAHAPRFA